MKKEHIPFSPLCPTCILNDLCYLQNNQRCLDYIPKETTIFTETIITLDIQKKGKLNLW